MTVLTPDLAVIGAGSGGLSVAAGAAQMGASVVLIERGRMGGDCLNYGCVPSKSLLAAAHAAHTIRTAGRFGVNGHEPEVDFRKVREHVHGVIAGIAPARQRRALRGPGRHGHQGAGPLHGRPRDRGRRRHHPARAAPCWPPARAPPSRRCPGLDEVPYLTNETIFDLGERPGASDRARRRPDRLRARPGPPPPRHARHRAPERLHPAQGRPRAVAVVRRALLAEGVDLREGVEVRRVERRGNRIAVVSPPATAPERGRGQPPAGGGRPPAQRRGAEPRGRRHRGRAKGVTTDASLKHHATARCGRSATSPAGRQFTHIAGYHAGIVIRQALFRLPAKVDDRAVPWATYTDPELAQVGLTAAGARGRRAEGRRPSPCPSRRTTAPRPSGRPRASSRSWSTARAASTAPRSWARGRASWSSSGASRSRSGSGSARWRR